MKSTLSFFFRHYLFWILLFICFRVVFLINQSPWNDGIAIKESIVSIVAGFRLDFSTASYFAAAPFLLTIILIFGLDKFIAGAMKLYYQLLLFIVILLSISNIILYKNWGTLLNSRGLSYAMQPTEMLASVSGIDIVFILSSIAIIFVLFNFIYQKFVHTTFKNIIGTSWMRTSALIFMLPIIGIGIRGGLQLIPINESSAYFSNKRVLNNIAINNIWYLGHNLKQSDVSEKNPYTWMDDNKALQIKNSLFIPVQDRENIFNLNKQPNLVFILLESWTADIIEPLGGIKGVTPFFTSLASKGLLFSSVYSSGFRTDQALVSVISGFPAQPNKSIIRFPDKTSSLPSIASILKKEGYHTSFYYGGELGFANMQSYLVTAGFDHIVGKAVFPDNSHNSKWGAHDGYVLDYHLNDLNKTEQPFFSTLLTLSTHEPFEVPIQTPFNDNTEPELFKKSAWYTDKCLETYFNQASKQDWFSNTIFVLVADHGHRLPLKRDYYDPLIRKIPLLIFSPLLKPEYVNTGKGQTGNQNDIAATILNSLNISSNSFEWSNDLLSKNRKNFAYLSLDEAFIWVEDSTFTTLRFDDQKEKSASNPSAARAYLQLLYKRFLAY